MGVKLRGKYFSHDPILVLTLNKTSCNIVLVGNEVTNWSASKKAGSKLLPYRPDTSATIMFSDRWLLRVAFSSVTWKRFCLGDLSVSWCLWSMIVMGNYSTCIKTTPPLKWNEFFILKLFRTWECVLCKNVLFAHGGAPLPYSQQTKVVSTSNLSRCPHTRVHRAGLWHSNTSTTLWRQTFHFFCGATQKPWIWRNGSFGTIFIFCDRVSTDKMESVWRFFVGCFF